MRGEFCFVQYRQASAKWTPEQGEDFETLAPTYIISRKLLGEGAQAKVYVGFDTCRNCQVACKEISLGCHRKEAASIRKRSRLESSILRKLNHPNVLRFEYAATTEKTWYLLTSLSTGGDLFSFMTKTDINETVIRTIILQIVMGLVHIHDKGIVHRDIKPENIQFSVAPKVTYPVVIADFGHATFLRRGKMLTSMAGTTPFRAPEIHYHEPYDFAVDIWALGITILTMLMPNHLDTFGKLFSYSQEGVDSSLERVFKHSKIKIRRNGRSFIRACLRIDAKERMSSNEALKHSWINYKNHDMRVVYKRVMSRWRQCPPRVDMANNIPASQTPGAQPENLAFPKNGSSHSKKSFPKEEVQDVANNLPWSDTLPLSLREAAEKPNSTATTLEPTHCSSCEQNKSKSWQ
ncbi:kinase-like protein [Ceratocystis lukuohia]|uniref:Kinase-like protein n=1 Tax=Ceratocystis lukuohia TaxID=2019550 RepID=A0ABR4MEH3_9PEZI